MTRQKALPRIVKYERIRYVEKEWRRWLAAEKHRYRTVHRHEEFLERYVPAVQDVVDRCSTRIKWWRCAQDRRRYKWAPIGCHEVPWCVFCMKREEGRRVRAALDKFNRCTPKDEKPRFVHIVQTAPVYEDGTGVGIAASKDVTAFGGAVWKCLQGMYPDGIGALMSYQDFGERAFAKRHPHMDLTLNGWMLGEDGVAHTPRVELQGRGRTRWDELMVDAYRELHPSAERGNVKVRAVRQGSKAYYSMLRYQMRELVDVRKMHYKPTTDRIEWWSYHDNQREVMPVLDFLAGMAEYSARLGQWRPKDEAMQLHRTYGHMADRRLRKTQKAMGGQPLSHGADCPCAECGDWDRVYPDVAAIWSARE